MMSLHGIAQHTQDFVDDLCTSGATCNNEEVCHMYCAVVWDGCSQGLWGAWESHDGRPQKRSQIFGAIPTLERPGYC
eukprot:10416354-Karenia_brevis.AAC.1